MLLELKLIVNPLVGASPPVKFRVSVPVPPPAVTLSDDGEKAIVGAVTVMVVRALLTDAELPATVVAAHLTLDVPKLLP